MLRHMHYAMTCTDSACQCTFDARWSKSPEPCTKASLIIRSWFWEVKPQKSIKSTHLSHMNLLDFLLKKEGKKERKVGSKDRLNRKKE